MLTTRSNIRENSGWQWLTREEWLMQDPAWDYIWKTLRKSSKDGNLDYLRGSEIQPKFPALSSAPTMPYQLQQQMVPNQMQQQMLPHQMQQQMSPHQMQQQRWNTATPDRNSSITPVRDDGYHTDRGRNDESGNSKRRRRDSTPLDVKLKGLYLTADTDSLVKASTAMTDKAYNVCENMMADLFSSLRLTNNNLLIAVHYLELHLTKCQSLMEKVPEENDKGHRHLSNLLNSRHWIDALLPSGIWSTDDETVTDAWGDKWNTQNLREVLVGHITRATMNKHFDGFSTWEQALSGVPTAERHGFLEDNCSKMVDEFRPLSIVEHDGVFRTHTGNVLNSVHTMLQEREVQRTVGLREWMQLKRPATVRQVDVAKMETESNDPVAAAMSWPEHWSPSECLQRVEDAELQCSIEESAKLLELRKETEKLEQKRDTWSTDYDDDADVKPISTADWWANNGINEGWEELRQQLRAGIYPPGPNIDDGNLT